jgi:hypothetical protein
MLYVVGDEDVMICMPDAHLRVLEIACMIILLPTTQVSMIFECAGVF